VVAPVRSLLQPLVTGLGDLEPVMLRPGAEVAMDDAVRRLAGAGYARVDMVDKRGQFAVRGGILDVFPPTEEHPLRVEYWGDTVEEVRWFTVADQRSLGEAPHGVWAPPCRELLLTDAVRARAAALVPTHPEIADILGQLAEGIYVEGMEALAPVLADGMELLVDVVPRDTLVVSCDPERVRARAHDLVATSQEFLEASWHNAAAGNATPIDLGEAAYRTVADVRAHAATLGLSWWSVSPFTADAELADLSDDPQAVAAAPTSSPSTPARPSRTTATPRGPSSTPARGWPPAVASCSSPRATVLPRAWSSSSRTPTCPRGSTSTSPTSRSPASST
jgi:transcription-repair coupling factor (superfamily II helicase)